MSDYLENQIDSDLFEILYEDGSYAQVQDKYSRDVYEVHASGNGDSYNHKVEFKILEP